MIDHVGQQFGNYRLVRLLGQEQGMTRWRSTKSLGLHERMTSRAQ